MSLILLRGYDWMDNMRIQHSHCFFFAELFHKCGLWNKETNNIFMYLAISENTILNKNNIGEGSHNCHHTGKTIFLPPQKRFKGSHTDNVLENIFFRIQRGSNYELVVFWGCKPSANSLTWHSSLNLNLFVVWRRSFSSTVSVCDPLNISAVGWNRFAVRWQCAIFPNDKYFRL